MEWKVPVNANLTIAENQDEYYTIRVRKEVRTFSEPGGDLYRAPCITLCLEPTPDELARLNAGELVFVTILGTRMPPISVCVGDPNPQSVPDD